MCGIVGWIDLDRDISGEGGTLAAMAETMAARGPDASGLYVMPHVAFGHRRLSVIDPANGAQPMVKNHGGYTYIITYNGELYNTGELKQELTARGYDFRTNCDTEVLLVAYIEWGERCIEKFNGIFAFGIWDDRRRQLFLARDRIGVKPLFYCLRDNRLLFASELKALLAHPEVQAELDGEGLAEVFMLGPARTPGHGVFRGMQELKPGYALTYSHSGLRCRPYWSLVSAPHHHDFDTTAGMVRYLLEDTVKRQLVADVPVCALLSGGLDSSVLAALSAQSYQDKGQCLHTYSVDYLDNDRYFTASSFQPNDDAPWVTLMVQTLGTQHHTILLDTPELAGSLPQAALARDLPGMADVDTSLYLFCREIKKGATVALSGECADEVFGGYPWFYREEMVKAQTFPWALKPEIRMEWLLPDVLKSMRPLEYVADRYHDALAEVPRLPGETAVEERMREIFYLSLTRWMPTLLDRKDRMSMACGLEVRVPYCDHRLVEYVWNVPWSMKYWQEREKGLLRQALTGLLPEDVLWRKKSPYPKTHNPAYLQTVRTWALEILEDSRSPLRPLINVKRIKEIAQSDLSASNRPWFGQLMGGAQMFAYFIQLDAWLREYHVRIVA